MDIYRIGSGKWVITGFIFTVVFGYFIFGPYGSSFNEALGKKIIDSEFFLSRDYISQYFNDIPENMVSKFVYFHVIDSFFALSYSIFLWSVFVRIFLMKLEFERALITGFALLGGLFDLLENITLILLAFLAQRNSQFNTLSTALVVFTPAKFILLLVAVIILLIGLVVLITRRGSST